MRNFYFILAILLLSGCGGGPDYTPVYFSFGDSSKDKNTAVKKTDVSTSAAECSPNLEATLCVKIKGGRGNLDLGGDPQEPQCAKTPPIPMEISGEKISLKGTKFPDIQVHVKIKGVDTPMTINGKGETDGSGNSGAGTWNPEGDIQIEDFSFYVKVLGVTFKIPNLTLTTGTAKKTPDLETIEGIPADESGYIKLVTATVLGHLFEAADNVLLGASMQATLEGNLDMPLKDCLKGEEAGQKKIDIVKLHLTSGSTLVEEPLPEENILEISQGTYIANSDADVGPSFETSADFKMTNQSSDPIDIKFPSQTGPFYFLVEGKTKRTLKPQASFNFQVIFRPTKETVKEKGDIKETIRFGRETFYLTGTALEQGGQARLSLVDESGIITAANINTLSFNTMSAPTTARKQFFHCKNRECDGAQTITACSVCTPPNIQNCLLKTVNTEGQPLEEVGEDCKPKYNSPVAMDLDLASENKDLLKPLTQVVTLRNLGVLPLNIKKIHIQEISNSKSIKEFSVSKILIGETLQSAKQTALPVSLPPFQKDGSQTSLFVAITYLPIDLKGYDGNFAAGQPATDRARLILETEAGLQETELVAKTKVLESAPLQVYFATATGYKQKLGDQSFVFEEVTAQTLDMAVPVFLKLSDNANQGMRVSEIKITGKDAKFFEWLNNEESVATREPQAGKGKRCSIPSFDTATHRLLSESFDLDFVSLGGQGFDLKPGSATLENLPLFGCLNFHKEPAQNVAQRLFNANLEVKAFELDPQGKPIKNPDNSLKQMELRIPLVAAIDPLRGKYVLRLPQTVFAILQAISPTVGGMPAQKEVIAMLKEGRGSEKELNVMLGALILDPFDEMEITDAYDKIASTPGDGVTVVFRQLDARPTSTQYDEDYLNDFASLLHDSDLPGGQQGIFHDYDEFENHPLPNPLKTNAWRIFTGALSYPGPIHPRAPVDMNQCELIDPCSSESLSKFSESIVGPNGKGACAFFHASSGRYHSPAFEPAIQGLPHNLCDEQGKPQEIIAMNNGVYNVDGSVTMPDLGLRFWGPNYYLNPFGPLGDKPALDEVFHVAFTTEMLKPKKSESDLDVLPDEKIDFAKLEHKINLTEKNLSNPPVCPNHANRRTVGGKSYNSWRYLAPFIFKDEAGETKASCPDGGTAFLKGRRIDPETGIFSLVTAGKFGSREDLSLAFKNVMIFVVLNGWVCDPQGDEAKFEGAKCFDQHFNDRDAKAQISFMDE